MNFGRGYERQVLSTKIEHKMGVKNGETIRDNPEVRAAYDEYKRNQDLKKAAQASAPRRAMTQEEAIAAQIEAQKKAQDAKVKQVLDGNMDIINQPGKEAKEIRGLAQGAQNRNALFKAGQTSAYGASNVSETVAEAFADVYAHGKEASKLNKQLVKRMWRQLNPDAAYEEYRQKQADYASGKRRKPGTH